MTLSGTKKAAIFLSACVILLFLPGIGDVRWAGLIGFIYIGLPWYILALKDSVEAEILAQPDAIRSERLYSPTLLFFGAICVLLGLTIDLVILYQFFQSQDLWEFGSQVLLRLFVGAPFIGFGVYFVYLSLGRLRRAT